MRSAVVPKSAEVCLEIESRPNGHSLRLVTDPPGDYALAQAAAKGARSALGVLYERHRGRVYAVCLSMVHDSAEAEDLTQEVFIHLLDKIGSFRGESQFSTWLHRLTVNLVLMRLRRKNPGLRQLLDEPGARRVEGRFSPVTAFIQIADRIALQSALAKLPLGCRTVFVLFDIAGFKHEEISAVLGCSVGTSKSQLYRARMKLRGILSSRRPASRPTTRHQHY